MMKKNLIILFLGVLTLSSCSIDMMNRVNGNRNVTTQNRTTGEEFTSIRVSSGLDLHLTQGTKNSVVVEADENLQDIIITEVRDGVLKIYTDKNIWRAASRKVLVTCTDIEAITATSGSDVYGKSVINAKSLKVTSTSGADVRLEVAAENVETKSTSGSNIRIKGNTITHSSKATSGASIDAYGLLSKDVTVNVSSGADINIHASESLNAKASSGGDIDVKGNPKKVTKKSSSGGSVSSK
ncbi:MAG: DUF2807 domain-containing protein [Flavobacteriaceae bacterium]|nr:DUF2807 domain-containing protein [Flavobacteriaceae bacterium]